MRILVTRPLEDARQTARELARRGHEALVAPLISIRFLGGPSPALGGAQAILATSGNGVRALARRSEQRDVSLFAVGSHTAGLARSLGFTKVVDAKGDWRSLANRVQVQLRPEAGPLLVVAGADASPDLPASMERAGFQVRICAAYETVEAPALPAPAREALRSEMLDAALLFSPRSADLLARRVHEAQLAAACRRLIACCISETTAHALDGLGFREVRVATRPDQATLIALVGSALPSQYRRA
jgi:uroporphyrinogen-III synthase